MRKIHQMNLWGLFVRVYFCIQSGRVLSCYFIYTFCCCFFLPGWPLFFCQRSPKLTCNINIISYFLFSETQWFALCSCHRCHYHCFFLLHSCNSVFKVTLPFAPIVATRKIKRPNQHLTLHFFSVFTPNHFRLHKRTACTVRLMQNAFAISVSAWVLNAVDLTANTIVGINFWSFLCAAKMRCQDEKLFLCGKYFVCTFSGRLSTNKKNGNENLKHWIWIKTICWRVRNEVKWMTYTVNM